MTRPASGVLSFCLSGASAARALCLRFFEPAARRLPGMGASYDKIAGGGACFLTPIFGVLGAVLFLHDPLTAAFAAGALRVGAGVVFVNRRQRDVRGEELRDVAATLLGELDQLLRVLAMRRLLGYLALVIVAEALHDAPHVVGRVAQAHEQLRR